jgi:hypothetical protein
MQKSGGLQACLSCQRFGKRYQYAQNKGSLFYELAGRGENFDVVGTLNAEDMTVSERKETGSSATLLPLSDTHADQQKLNLMILGRFTGILEFFHNFFAFMDL